jgi:hypothetical protein
MRSVKGLSRGTLSSDSASVEIVPLVTDASSATLRDIKEPVEAPGPDPLELLLGLTALATAGWLAWRARRRAPAPASASPAIAATPPAAPPEPYEIALDRLAAIEAERWDARDVARHYEAVADALRDYLEAAEALPARERTTAEVLWSLPPRLSAGLLRRQYESLFDEADLVKFARRRPDAAAAAAFLGRARTLLAGWREAAAAEEMADALR